MSKKVVVIVICALIAVVAGLGFTLTSKSPATGDVVRNAASHDTASEVDKDRTIKDVPVISKPPKSLVVKADDLPNAFIISNGESPATNEYSHVYFNPGALLEGDQQDHGLLGMIVHIKVLNSVVDASREFVNQGGFDLEAVKADIRKATPGARPISIESQSVSLDEVDKISAYRVHYLLQGIYVYDYRCRMMVRNVVANVIVSARGSVDLEPGDLKKQAEEIFQKQRDRLLQSID